MPGLTLPVQTFSRELTRIKMNQCSSFASFALIRGFTFVHNVCKYAIRSCNSCWLSESPNLGIMFRPWTMD